MNALESMHYYREQAANWWQTWENNGQESAYHRGKAEQAEARSAQFAVIVQAEALERIAKTLEAMASATYGIEV